MANPKHRKSHSKTRKGRSHHALTAPALTRCQTCGELMMPHHVCPACGSYKERKVLTVE